MEEKGFFGKLFDSSFTKFMTPGIIQPLFVLGVVWAFIKGCWFCRNMFQGDWLYKLAAIPAGIIVFFITILVVRVVLECILALFQIANNSSRVADKEGV